MFNSQGKFRGFPISLLATPGGEQLARLVDKHLIEIYRENGERCPSSFIRKSTNHRFQNGEGKAVINDSVRGTDLFIITDVGNYGVTYNRYGMDVPMSPDEHYEDIKRLLGAVKNMGQRINLISPLLYESRQHRMDRRESLDCALALQELARAGVDTFMTLDAHNSHVMNAIPMHGLENLHAAYQIIEAFLKDTDGVFDLVPDQFVICSPDLGGLDRARYYAQHFQVELTGFYKFRDLTRVVGGKNPVLEHRFLGIDVEGRNFLVVDDILASGGSLIDTAEALKSRGAKNIYLAVTFALFTEGFERFDEAYKKGLFRKIYGTNGTHIPAELTDREWFEAVDVSRFIAKYIHTLNHDGSVTKLLDSTEKITKLLTRRLPERRAAGDARESKEGVA